MKANRVDDSTGGNAGPHRPSEASLVSYGNSAPPQDSVPSRSSTSPQQNLSSEATTALLSSQLSSAAGGSVENTSFTSPNRHIVPLSVNFRRSPRLA